MLFAGLVLLVALLDVGVGPEIVTWPLLLAGSGLGMMASQLGAVTVSSVPDEKSGEVGGLQNTGTQLGASIGTALAGAVLISAMTASFFTGIENNPNVPDSVVSQAQTQLAGGVPFMSEADAKAALQEGERAPRDRRRDRQAERKEPDRRTARRRGHPRAPRARGPPVHPRHPDRPTRRPSQAQTIPGIADAAASRNHHTAALLEAAGGQQSAVEEEDHSDRLLSPLLLYCRRAHLVAVGVRPAMRGKRASAVAHGAFGILETAPCPRSAQGRVDAGDDGMPAQS